VDPIEMEAIYVAREQVRWWREEERVTREQALEAIGEPFTDKETWPRITLIVAGKWLDLIA
jgi:hypothetical protein